ncbi:MAG TPA: hypothetical protein VF544_10815 [Pyrinomonadaceae bacterium]|jgi:hypothetical protein
MKTLLALLLPLFCASVAHAQEQAAPTPSASPAITVTKVKWSRHYQAPLMRRSANGEVISAATPSYFPSLDPYLTPRYPQEPVYSPFPASGRLSYVYEYSAKIKNDKAQAIRALSWDYVVSDPASHEELRRHHFYSYEKIGKNSEATLKGNSAASPSNVVTVSGLGKDKRSPYDERVEFMCVVYADGTTWQNPSARAGECQRLINRPRMRRRPRL